MRLSDTIREKLIGIIQPLAESMGLELVDVDIRQDQKRSVLEVIIDKEGGVSVDDCADLSKQVSLTLDVEDPIPGRYVLEVGSPGIFRELKSEKEIKKYIGERVKIKLISTIKGKNKIVGILKGMDNQIIQVTDDDGDISLAYQEIKKIQLFPDI